MRLSDPFGFQSKFTTDKISVDSPIYKIRLSISANSNTEWGSREYQNEQVEFGIRSVRLILQIKKGVCLNRYSDETRPVKFFDWVFKSPAEGLFLSETDLEVCRVMDDGKGIELKSTITVYPYDIIIRELPASWPDEKLSAWNGLNRQKVLSEVTKNVNTANSSDSIKALEFLDDPSSVLATIKSASQHVKKNTHCSFEEARNLWCLELDDLDGIDLSSQNLEKAKLGFARLRKSNLRNADFRGADMIVCSLDGANLDSAVLAEALLQKARLSGASLRYANCQSVSLYGATLSGADLECADLSHACLIRADLHNANLRNANLSHADLSKAVFCGANMIGTNFNNAKISGTAFNDAITTEHTARKLGVDFQKADSPGTVVIV